MPRWHQPPSLPLANWIWDLSEALKHFHRLVFVKYFGTANQLKCFLCPPWDDKSIEHIIITPAVLPAGNAPSCHTHCARQAGRMVTKSCLGSFKHFCDSENESVFIHVRCNIFIQSTHWLFLIEWPVSICQNNSLGTKPLVQETTSCPGHSWTPNAS